MSPETPDFYEFANFRLNLAQKVLLRDGKPIPVTPKVYDTLEILVENNSRLLEKDELMQKLWPDRFVEEGNLTSNIKMLRKALGDDAANPRFIETVPRRGYRFIGEVKARDEASPPRPIVEKAEEPPGPIRKRHVLISVVAILVISVFGIAFVWVGGNGLFKSKKPKFTRLTTSGKVTNAALAPDGRSVVFSQKEGAGESLWLRQIDSGNQTQILPPEDVEFVGLTVSPDGNFAYYSVFSKNSAVTTLSRVALGGSAPESILNVDTDVSVSFSPDGKRFAFIDTHTSLKETDLTIADADGTNQQVLLKTAGESRVLPFFRASPVAWSPDGETLACAIKETDDSGSAYRILLVDPESGREKYLSNQAWSGVENLVWRDNDNLAFIEIEQNSPVRRIWQVSRSSGEAHQLTNDLNGYEWLGSAGGRLITLQKIPFSSLHVVRFEENSSIPPPKQIFGESGVIESVGWSRGDKILYNSLASGKNEIWQINTDGTSPQQLTNDSHLILNFAVSPTDDSLVFSALNNGKVSLEAAGPDGQNTRPLTDGSTDFLPAFSPNGETVVFQRGESPSTLWSVAFNGSQPPQQLTGYQATHAAVSPDGKQIAFHFMDYGSKNPHWKLGLIDSQTHDLVNKLEFPMPITQRDTAWNPKNNLITMAFGNGENSNILLWSVADGRIQTLDNIDVGRIAAFAWSPDGSKLIFSRVFETSDVVLLENF